MKLLVLNVIDHHFNTAVVINYLGIMHIRLILCQIDYKTTLYKFTIIIGNIVHIVLYNSIFMLLLTRIVLQDQLNALLFFIEKLIIGIIKKLL